MSKPVTYSYCIIPVLGTVVSQEDTSPLSHSRNFMDSQVAFEHSGSTWTVQGTRIVRNYMQDD